ncbi:hypothetical protein D3C87_1951100 [compost metagenome]
MQTHTDIDSRLTTSNSFFVEVLKRLTHIQTSHHRIMSIAWAALRSTPNRHDRITDKFIDDTTTCIDDLNHRTKILIEHFNDFLWRTFL